MWFVRTMRGWTVQYNNNLSAISRSGKRIILQTCKSDTDKPEHVVEVYENYS